MIGRNRNLEKQVDLSAQRSLSREEGKHRVRDSCNASWDKAITPQKAKATEDSLDELLGLLQSTSFCGDVRLKYEGSQSKGPEHAERRRSHFKVLEPSVPGEIVLTPPALQRIKDSSPTIHHILAKEGHKKLAAIPEKSSHVFPPAKVVSSKDEFSSKDENQP